MKTRLIFNTSELSHLKQYKRNQSVEEIDQLTCHKKSFNLVEPIQKPQFLHQDSNLYSKVILKTSEKYFCQSTQSIRYDQYGFQIKKGEKYQISFYQDSEERLIRKKQREKIKVLPILSRLDIINPHINQGSFQINIGNI